MKRHGILAAMMFVAACGFVSDALAGGGLDDHEDQEAEEGTSYHGFVKDTRGSPMPEARVSAEIKNRGTIVTHTNILGAYRISNFGKEINPDDITISCSKDGYKQLRVVRRQEEAAGKTLIEVECILQRQ